MAIVWYVIRRRGAGLGYEGIHSASMRIITSWLTLLVPHCTVRGRTGVLF